MEASAAILVVEAEIVHRHAVARFGHFGRAVVGFAVQRAELTRVAVGGRRPAPAAQLGLNHCISPAGIGMNAAPAGPFLILLLGRANYLYDGTGTVRNGAGRDGVGRRAGIPYNIPSALMSSSTSGQCTPSPSPMIS